MDRHRPCLWRRRATAEGYWHLHPMWRRRHPRAAGHAARRTDARDRRSRCTSPVAAICAAPLALFSPEYGGSNHHARCGRRSVNARRSSWARLFPRCLATVTSRYIASPSKSRCPIPGVAAASRSARQHGDLLILSAARPDAAQAASPIACGDLRACGPMRGLWRSFGRMPVGGRCHSLTGSSCVIDLPARPRRVSSPVPQPRRFPEDIPRCVALQDSRTPGGRDARTARLRRVWNQSSRSSTGCAT